MGVHKNIGFEAFPKQGTFLGKTVSVCFNYDTSCRIEGKIVRDDTDEPYLTIIALADGRYVLATECGYAMPPWKKQKDQPNGNE